MYDLEAANALVKELKAKIDQLEKDKLSLFTAIRIIQEDNNAQVNHHSPKNNPWVKVTQSTKKSKSQSKSKQVDNNITSTNPYMLKSKTNLLKHNLVKHNRATLKTREQTIALETPKNQIPLML